MNDKQIKFVRIYLTLLYKYGYHYFDISKEYFEAYTHELKKIMEAKNMFDKYEYLKELFIYNQETKNYDNFKNIVLFTKTYFKGSYIDKTFGVIILNINEQQLNNILSDNTFDIRIIDNIVNYMINYIKQDIKVKIIK